jgi:hypothetical protein
MAANLEVYRFHLRPIDVVGAPILTTAPASFTAVSNTSPGVVFTGVDMSVLRDSEGFHTSYPLFMKLFCKDVSVDSTGEFIVSVNGSLAGMSSITYPSIHRQDDKNFVMAWSLGYSGWGRSWDSISSSDATISINPLSPMTSVSMNCILGVATDNINRPDQN